MTYRVRFVDGGEHTTDDIDEINRLLTQPRPIFEVVVHNTSRDVERAR